MVVWLFSLDCAGSQMTENGWINPALCVFLVLFPTSATQRLRCLVDGRLTDVSTAAELTSPRPLNGKTTPPTQQVFHVNVFIYRAT